VGFLPLKPSLLTSSYRSTSKATWRGETWRLASSALTPVRLSDMVQAVVVQYGAGDLYCVWYKGGTVLYCSLTSVQLDEVAKEIAYSLGLYD